MLLGDPVRPERLASGLGREARIRERRAKRRVLLGVRFGELSQRCGRLRLPLLPTFTPAKGCVRPSTAYACAVFRQPHLHRLAAPAHDRLGEPCAAVTVF